MAPNPRPRGASSNRARPANTTPVHHEHAREAGVSNSVCSSRSTAVRRQFPVKRVRCRSVLRRRGTRCSHWGRGHLSIPASVHPLYGRLPLTTGEEQQFRTGFTGNIDLCQGADMRRVGTSAGGAECLAERAHFDAARFTWNMLESRDHPADCTAGRAAPAYTCPHPGHLNTVRRALGSASRETRCSATAKSSRAVQTTATPRFTGNGHQKTRRPLHPQR